MNERNGRAQTPEEIDRAMEKLAKMDRAEGIFGEAVLDEDLEMIAGGVPQLPSRGEDPPDGYRSYDPEKDRPNQG